MSGPAHDLQLMVSLMREHQVAQRLAFLCLDSLEMRMQSHQDCKPLVIIRYRPTYETITVIRSVMQSEDCIEKLSACHVHVALMGSHFDDKACDKELHVIRTRKESAHCQICVVHPTMSSSRMVIGNILTGDEGEFLSELGHAIDEACQAAEALRDHRDLLENTRILKRKQEEAFRLSAIQDRRKSAFDNEKQTQETNKRPGTSNEQSTNDDNDETLLDSEEMRNKRLAALAALGGEVGHPKRTCTRQDSGEDEAESSGTVSDIPAVMWTATDKIRSYRCAMLGCCI
ncbi:hypothetical protein OS493_037587 [Desmophyllum pertusum]|uniref:Uncharacterized protein n=1 Tax=Desmophyllum pertusum TaxID=174260 RepID=A0A9X0CC73_9CNID|nr:hypothetical protein OS493_037587 [Desmophyllum pertusum]